MAIFTAEEYGDVIERCWLGGKDITHLATCASIPSIPTTLNLPPISNTVQGLGWVDILDTMDEGYPYLIVGDDGELVVTRHFGIIKLEWMTDA